MNNDHYDNGTKQTWRGWWLNRVCERIAPCYRKEAVMVYLPGPQDRDRPAAIAKGFSNRNIIAVDSDMAAIESVRKAGGIATNGSLEGVLRNWPEGVRIDVVCADLLGGVSIDAFALLKEMSWCGHGGTVCVINAMRGRDRMGGWASSVLSTASQCEMQEIARFFRHEDLHGDLAIHRGFQLFMLLSASIQNTARASAELAGYRGNTLEDFVGEMIGKFLLHARPYLYSYRSERGMYFDSLVFTAPWGRSEVADLRGELSTTRCEKSDQRTKRRNAAMAAIRTKKSAGKRKGILASSRPGFYL